ncbi:hypothetical protein N7468_005447 [Penicillium chermesinum]|uniref:Myb-like domain-containing protein n=1 Tax=Penicillium chermesinum TaxID=63820 RepID=A0A9W9TN00_9EURO|nr:uncharacterized protein N7468_005447 [Penicillium chermesinum]KAJ5232491.1 hypothetical protein N7468_005447 [Penicillium chermesinum]
MTRHLVNEDATCVSQADVMDHPVGLPPNTMAPPATKRAVSSTEANPNQQVPSSFGPSSYYPQEHRRNVGYLNSMVNDSEWQKPALLSEHEETSSLSSSFGLPDPSSEDQFSGHHFYSQLNTQLIQAQNKDGLLQEYQRQSMVADSNNAPLMPDYTASGYDLWIQDFGFPSMTESHGTSFAQSYNANTWNNTRRAPAGAQPVFQPGVDYPAPTVTQQLTSSQRPLPLQRGLTAPTFNGQTSIGPARHFPRDNTAAPVSEETSSQSMPSAPSSSSSPTLQQDETPSIPSDIHSSDKRDAFLIHCKRRGLSYKDIKRLGGFKEAESTLRGRYRTLTKAKEDRVRKPKWLEQDAVPLCTSNPSDHSTQPKVSWKGVSQYIAEKGGSYQFGNATCKKKWCEINKIKG